MPDPQQGSAPELEEEPCSLENNKFHWACMNGHVEGTSYWLEQGADVSLIVLVRTW